MKKATAKRKGKASTPRPRREERNRGGATKRGRRMHIRTIYGADARGIPYRKDFFEGGTVTTYGKTPPPAPTIPAKDAPKEELMRYLAALDRCDEAQTEAMQFSESCCHLVRRQKTGQRATWSFYGPDVTLLRGEIAKGPMQGRWDDPESMSLLRALESVRDYPERMGEWDGGTVRSALLTDDPKREAMRDAALRAVKAGGRWGKGENPRPWRIAKAVVDAAKLYDRPPSASEVFDRFKEMESKRGAGVGKASDNARNFYRDLKASGWGWLAPRRRLGNL